MSEEEAEKKKIYRATGVTADNVVYESVFYVRIPVFLILRNNVFSLLPKIETEDTIILPLSREKMPYRPYVLDEKTLETLNSPKLSDLNEQWNLLYQKCLAEYKAFLDISPPYRILEAVQTLETYQQHKLLTTSYLFHFGETDSGKTQALDVHNGLDYRPLYSMNLPSANIYSFLGYHEEGCGTILEDEAEDLIEYTEKMKIYRAGYKKGQTVPRIEFSKRGERIQRFYKAFCCKSFAGRWIPNDEAFKQRCIPVLMVEGVPEKDEVGEEDFQRFDEIKLELLAYRMRTFFDKMPNIDIGIRGRMKELWKPKFQVVNGITAAKEIIKQFANEQVQLREEERRSQFEAYLARAVIDNYVSLEGKEVPFGNIWEHLKIQFDVPDDKVKDNSMQTSQFGNISKTYVGLRLASVFGAEKRWKKGAEKLGRAYFFKRDALSKLAKRYRLESQYKKDLDGLNGLDGPKRVGTPTQSHTPTPTPSIPPKPIPFTPSKPLKPLICFLCEQSIPEDQVDYTPDGKPFHRGASCKWKPVEVKAPEPKIEVSKPSKPSMPAQPSTPSPAPIFPTQSTPTEVKPPNEEPKLATVEKDLLGITRALEEHTKESPVVEKPKCSKCGAPAGDMSEDLCNNCYMKERFAELRGKGLIGG